MARHGGFGISLVVLTILGLFKCSYGYIGEANYPYLPRNQHDYDSQGYLSNPSNGVRSVYEGSFGNIPRGAGGQYGANAPVQNSPSAYGARSPYGANAYGSQQQYGNPYGAQQYGGQAVANPYGVQQQYGNPYGGAQAQYRSPYGAQQQYGNPYGAQAYANPYGAQQQYGNPYGAQQYANPYAAPQQYGNPYAAPQQYRSPFGAQQYANPYNTGGYSQSYGQQPYGGLRNTRY